MGRHPLNPLIAAWRRTESHTPDADCNALHCYVHQVDEPNALPDVGGIACGECNHAYRTGRDLRRAHIRAARHLYWSDLRNPHHWARTLGRPWMTRTAALLNLALVGFTRTRTITFCPHCAHDL